MLFYYHSLQFTDFPSEQFSRLDDYDYIAGYRLKNNHRNIIKRPIGFYKYADRSFFDASNSAVEF